MEGLGIDFDADDFGSPAPPRYGQVGAIPMPSVAPTAMDVCLPGPNETGESLPATAAPSVQESHVHLLE